MSITIGQALFSGQLPAVGPWDRNQSPNQPAPGGRWAMALERKRLRRKRSGIWSIGDATRCGIDGAVSDGRDPRQVGSVPRRSSWGGHRDRVDAPHRSSDLPDSRIPVPQRGRRKPTLEVAATIPRPPGAIIGIVRLSALFSGARRPLRHSVRSTAPGYLLDIVDHGEELPLRVDVWRTGDPKRSGSALLLQGHVIRWQLRGHGR